MTITHSQAWDALNKMDNILLLTHRAPDGDAIGSIYALYAILKRLGKNVRVETDTVPASLSMAVDSNASADFNEEYVVTVDVGDKKLLGDELSSKYGEKVALNIDHHGTNVFFAENTLLDADAAAASEVIFDMLSEVGFELDKTIAAALYVGISTDTGCFRYSNTTAKTLKAAAALVETGIDNGEMNTVLFETKTRQYAAFEAMVMNSIKMYLNDKCALVLITKDMYKRANISEADAQGINALPRQIEGVYVGVTIKEKEGGVYRISIRTREPVDAAKICAVMSGGGHHLAAGCELTGNARVVINTVVNYAEQALKELNLL